MKRIFEFSAALFLIMLFSPLMIFIAAILLLTSEHRIFYFSNRVGQNKKIFKMVKFSTMQKNSHHTGTLEITLKNDPRILPMGRFLRNTKIDELPQLLNILKGEMGFVGPRPLPPRHFNYYTPQQQEMIAMMKPGITGIGSIFYRDEGRLLAQSNLPAEKCYEQVLTPKKAALEKWYFENRSTWTDLKILFCTLYEIFFRKNLIFHKLFK